jgi:hypothetical protein
MGNRARKAKGQLPPAEEPLDKARATSRFMKFNGRAIEVTFIPSGIVVPAKNPEELERETDREFVRRAGETES